MGHIVGCQGFPKEEGGGRGGAVLGVAKEKLLELRYDHFYAVIKLYTCL